MKPLGNDKSSRNANPTAFGKEHRNKKPRVVGSSKPLVVEGQPRVGHLSEKSINDTSRAGSPVENPNRQGYGRISQDPPPPTPRRTDKVTSIPAPPES